VTRFRYRAALAAAVLLALSARDAFAQLAVVATPSPTTVDLQDAALALLSLASAAVLAAIPIVVPYALKRWGVANDADIAGKVDAAMSDGAGMLYDYATKHVGGLANVDVRSAGLAAVLQHIDNQVGPEIKTLGYTDAHVTNMVNAGLGKLLAGDPTVTAGAPPQIPTPVTVPAPIPVHVVAAPAKIADPAPAGQVLQTGTSA
jgi:hypothetical protein